MTDIEWRPHARRHDDAATSGIARQQQIYKKKGALEPGDSHSCCRISPWSAHPRRTHARRDRYTVSHSERGTVTTVLFLALFHLCNTQMYSENSNLTCSKSSSGEILDRFVFFLFQGLSLKESNMIAKRKENSPS